MMQAVAHHPRAQKSKADGIMRTLLKARPKDAYYHELLGQILLEGRRFKVVVNAYGRAAKLLSNNALVLSSYGRTLFAAGQPKAAIKVLKNAPAHDFKDPTALRDLSSAYAKLGKPAMASLAVAERYALLGRLPKNSGPWQRAQDVLSNVQRQK